MNQSHNTTNLMHAAVLGLALTTTAATAQPAGPAVVTSSPSAADAKADVAWQTVPTRTISAGGVGHEYRALGHHNGGTPVVFLTHLAAVLDNWDPRVIDGIAARHRVIAFSDRGVDDVASTLGFLAR